MTTLRKATQQALEALEDMLGWESLAPQSVQDSSKQSLQRLREALAQPEPSPVAWIFTWYEIAKDRHVRRIIDCEERPNIPGYDLIPLYTHPPQRQPLTNDEIISIGKRSRSVEDENFLPLNFARAIERAHGIGSQE